MTAAVDRVRRENNFGFTRLLFAVFVIMSHSYPLVGLPEHDWLWTLTHGQFFFSWFGVRGIFVISGFLIFKSLSRCTDLSDFYWKRILRLFPPFAGVLFITVLLGPFVYASDVPYLHNGSVLTYIGNNLSLYNMQFHITGIFDNNPYKSVINGSVWTRPFEFTMYVVVSLLFFIRLHRRAVIVILAVLYVALAVPAVFYKDELQQIHFVFLNWLLVELGVYFAAGALLAACRVDKIPAKYINVSFWIIVLVVVLASLFSVLAHMSVLLTPLLTISFCLRPFNVISDIQEKIGDLSYGMHLYGFPIQQALVYFFGLNYLALMISSLALAAVFAYFSFHLIEKRLVKLKKIKPLGVLKQLWKMITNRSLENRSAGVD